MTKRWMRWLAAVAAAGLVAACGGGGGGGDPLFGDGDGNGSDGDGSVGSSDNGTVVIALSSSSISSSTPGTVSALVKDGSGKAMANTVVKFAVTGGKATVTPDSVLTDGSGSAAVSLQPVAGALGADYVSATADVPSEQLTARVAFTVSSVSVTLGAPTAAPTTIPAYGGSVISVPVNGASATAPVTVQFSSTCVTAGKASLSPSSVTVTGKVASTTYQDKGCSSNDRVSVVITGTSQQKGVDLAVSAPVAQSLQFVTANPSKICLAGSGCPASSVVSFRLIDEFGNPVSGRQINFSLDFPNVAKLSFDSAKTNADGVAEVSVTSGTVPSPVRVKGRVSGSALETVSNELAINAGLPTGDTISFSASTYSLDGLNTDGSESEIRLQLNDRFGNPVPDGTSVSLVAEGASVIPARCLTVDAVCRVKFVSSNSRPADGRVTVTAYAQGEESFVDQNGDNKYTLGEPITHLGKIFVDKNEDGDLDANTGEYLVGEAENSVWDSNTFVSASRVFVLASHAAPRLYRAIKVADQYQCTKTALPNIVLRPTTLLCQVESAVCIRDSNSKADNSPVAVLDAEPLVTVPDAERGNPIPSGSRVSVSTGAKGATVLVDNTPIPATVQSPTVHKIRAKLSDCSKPLEAAGALELTVRMPAGENYTFTVGSVE